MYNIPLENAINFLLPHLTKGFFKFNEATTRVTPAQQRCLSLILTMHYSIKTYNKQCDYYCKKKGYAKGKDFTWLTICMLLNDLPKMNLNKTETLSVPKLYFVNYTLMFIVYLQRCLRPTLSTSLSSHIYLNPIHQIKTYQSVPFFFCHAECLNHLSKPTSQSRFIFLLISYFLLFQGPQL